MLNKQSIINDTGYIKSVFSIHFVTRRPNTDGFRVALSETKCVSRKPTSVFSIHFVTRRPNIAGFRVEPNEVRFVSRKPLSVFSIRQISFVYSKTEIKRFLSRTERSEVRIKKTIISFSDKMKS